ncbi:DUF1654 domain-containing protein [Pseudomonas graminis]|jgi:hypothetical protein|uniref:DUF1654 domain-containing protein n=1 Tax=Pseudomonas graminis TaxID=158627 RepID=A0A6M8MBC4_9PSED|nr:DUF1654 domain-containing protein [Pseudomonas graminis]QKF52069.1 hypothetical protein FX982_03050 [Pseudomonas graminis]
MSLPEKKKPQEREPMSSLERLNLRVAGMINHPIAQDQMWVTIHKLETDGDREWNEVMGAIAEVDGIDMVFNDEDRSVTLKWVAPSDNDPRVQVRDEFEVLEEAAPF